MPGRGYLQRRFLRRQPVRILWIIGATVGAVIVLFVWHRLVVSRTIGDPGVSGRP